MVNFIKNILERCGIKIFLVILAGYLLYYIYFKIALIMSNPIFNYIITHIYEYYGYVIAFIFGYLISTISCRKILADNVEKYIYNHKYKSFQTTEIVPKNIVNILFNDLIHWVLYYILLISSWYVLSNIFKLSDFLLFEYISIYYFGYLVVIILLIIDILNFLKNNSFLIRIKIIKNKLVELNILKILKIIFVVILSCGLYIYNINLTSCLVAGIILSLSFSYGKYSIAKLFLIKPMLINILKKSIISKIINTNNYDTKIDEPIPLTEKTDCFGVLKKVNVIKESILHFKILESYKIIALYGNWGSGKSSVIKTLMDEMNEEYSKEVIKYYDTIKSKGFNLNALLNSSSNILKEFKSKKERFIPIKFDTWDYENEDNIAYALLNKIIEELEKDADIKFEIKAIKNEVLKSGAVVLKSFRVNTGFFNFNFECDSERYKEVENLKNGLNNLSNILSKNNKRLIVFIDELDRCERENILKFLASLKLFFTSGDNINYICAVDKEAVKEALENKYNDGEKAEEYLEKIFNFSFNMPKTFSVKKFIMQYKFFNNEEIAEKLAKFFEAINFITPRHLKKVMNKYEYLVKIKTSESINKDLKNLIPNIICISLECMQSTSKYYLKKYYPNQNRIEYIVKRLKCGSKNYLFDTIFVLYFIILYEFYFRKYLEIKNYEYKLSIYVSANVVNKSGGLKNNENDEDYLTKIRMVNNIKLDINKITFKEMYYYIFKNHGCFRDSNELVKFITLFTPIEIINNNEFYIGGTNILNNYLSLFEYKNNEILIDFCKYLISDEFFKIIEEENKTYTDKDYKFITLFEMVETLL